MKWVVLALLLPAIVAGPALGHAPAVEHVTPVLEEIGAGAQVVYHLHYERGDFAAGWLFTLAIRFTGGEGPVEISLTTENGTSVNNWVLTRPNVTSHLSALLPETGAYAIGIRNSGDAPAYVQFFYDQSCDCAFKPIPIEVPEGVVVFGVTVEGGARWRLVYPEPLVHTLTLHLAVLENDRAQWPEDFRVIEKSETPVETPDGLLHEFVVAPEERTRYYVFAESVDTDLSWLSQLAPEEMLYAVSIFPSYEEMDPLRQTPQPGFVGLCAIVVAAAIASGRARLR